MGGSSTQLKREGIHGPLRQTKQYITSVPNEVLLKTYYTDLIHQEADGPGKEMKLTIACAII